MISYIWLAIAIPLAGALINGLLGKHLGRRVVAVLGPAVVGLAFAVGVLAVFDLQSLPGESRAVTTSLWQWITIGKLSVGVTLLADPLSVLMVLVVAGVGLLIHVYSVGYMEHEDSALFARFFSYLNLFVASMLLLVLADNYLLMYVGWEMVGLCSYLLIGFWYHRGDTEQAPIELADGELVAVKPNLNPSDAGKKAFIVNRVGDFGFAVGVFLMWTVFGTLNFSEVFAAAPAVPAVTLTIITLLLFLGAAGKSAQLPLFVWLPDAMAGPSPVSALIHAATMVTAGVYLVARSATLYGLTPVSSLVVALVGTVTAIFAASIALVQTDLKRVLAYSTISQLGTMFLAVGVGAYTAGVFHLTTHAFFKALLFLAAGSIMHSLHEVIDIRRMGGLRRKMPLTYWTFLVGALALAAFPLTAGFFSKDEILINAFQASPWLWAAGILTALLTAFYTFRAFFLAFWGQPRDWELVGAAHEAPPVMTWPLLVLAVLAAVGGVIGLPHVLGVRHLLDGWLSPAFSGHAPSSEVEPGLEWVLLIVSSLVGLLGIGIAYWFYVLRPGIPGRLALQFRPVFRLLANKFYVDDLYDAAFVRLSKRLAAFLARVVDQQVIDGLIDGSADLVGRLGGCMAQLETGYVPHYALGMFLGAVALVAFFVLR